MTACGKIARSRTFAIALLLVAAVSLPAAAQVYPDKEIHIYCGFPPGSGADIYVRYFAEKLKGLAGKPVIVENKVGAGGNLAVEAVTHTKPDGLTLVISSGGPASYNVHLYKQLGYDPIKDFAPIATLVSFPFILVVDPKQPINSVQDSVATIKQRPRKGSYGAVGGTPIVLSELLKHDGGFDSVQVMYRTAPDSINDLLAGNLDFIFMDPAAALAQARQGRLRALAVSTPQRSLSAPDIPTMAEAGFSGVDRMAWFAALAKAGTPAPIVATLNGWFNQILAMEETKQFFRGVGAEVFPGRPEDLATLQTEEIAKWAELVKLAHMEVQ